jgi:hypothetical protein
LRRPPPPPASRGPDRRPTAVALPFVRSSGPRSWRISDRCRDRRARSADVTQSSLGMEHTSDHFHEQKLRKQIWQRQKNLALILALVQFTP